MPVHATSLVRRGSRGPRSLVEPAVALLVASARGAAAWPFGPLVIVSPGNAAASTLVTAAWDSAPAGDLLLGDGRALGRDIAAAMTADRGDRLAGLFASRALVVIDEVDGLGGAERQQAFGQLFDAATARGTLFCVSLRRHPSRAGLEPQLASRLCGGLVLFAAATPPPPRRSAGDREPSLARILRVVAARREITVADLVGPSRRQAVAAARALAMHLARGLTSKSLAEIGATCGGRDHTTVLHALKVVAARLVQDAGLSADVERCADVLGGRGGAPASRGRRRVDSPSVRLPRRA